MDLKHISEKPWGEISEADYTIEQWHNACLIHLHDGPPTSKSQCKLPVKTPNGALNRDGVHAAAGALAGARAPLKAPPDQKAKAAAALRRYYSQLDEKPPESLMRHTDSVEDILEHVGVKGMRWGVRKESNLSSVKVIDRGRKLRSLGGARRPAHPDAIRARTIGQVVKKSGTKAVSTQDLQLYANRLQVEQNISRLSSNNKSAGLKVSGVILKQAGNKVVSELTGAAISQVKKTLLKRMS